jgi:hypothetical protein
MLKNKTGSQQSNGYSFKEASEDKAGTRLAK